MASSNTEASFGQEGLEKRAQLFRGGRRRIPLNGRIALIVDDGIATGSTARAAAQVARAQGAARVVVATRVAPRDAFERLQADAEPGTLDMFAELAGTGSSVISPLV